MNRRSVFIVGLLLTLLAAGAVLRAVFAGKPTEFDALTWQTIETEADYEKRAAMLPSVFELRKTRQLGDKDSVRRLLGASDRNIPESDDTWIYLLAPDRQAATDNRYLEINFDDNDAVKTFTVRESNEKAREVDTVNEPQN